jgi:uncharacterized protein (TIGR02678 family)
MVVSEPSTTSPEVEADRRLALRALLRHPLLTATGETAEDYIRVRRHSEWMKQWLAKFPVWNLHIDKEVIRLRKLPADLRDETRPAIDRTSGTSFTKRRYALLCLALAALEQSRLRTTLGQITLAILKLVAADRALNAAGMILDVGNYDHRRDLVHAIRLLTEIGVLSRIDGDERQFLNRTDSSDVLYSVNRHVLAAILNISHSVSALATSTNPVATLLDDPAPLSEDLTQQIRSRLVRSLMDDPILYFHDLNEEERAYLEQHRGHLLRQIHDATGLIAEVRCEGIAMVDEGGDMTDLKLPDESAEGQLALTLAQWMAELPRNCETEAIPTSSIEQHVREIGEDIQLIEDAMLRLRALRLIRISDAGVFPLAACARYAHRTVFEEAS